MRVSAEVKQRTRSQILSAARKLLADNGFDATTTRDIAKAAGIASGTLFNYFPTKEAIVAALATEAIADTEDGPTPDRPNTSATLEEDLFALIAAGLRKMKPLRRHLPALLDTSLHPLATPAKDDATSLRLRHLEAVAAAAGRHGFADLSPTALQLYWTLYTGLLVFWANDPSPRQEDTLALIDDSVDMFVGWLRSQPGDRTP